MGHGPARLGAASSLGLGSRGACRAVLQTWEWVPTEPPSSQAAAGVLLPGGLDSGGFPSRASLTWCVGPMSSLRVGRRPSVVVVASWKEALTSLHTQEAPMSPEGGSALCEVGPHGAQPS